jgi:hypothetical protein
MVTIFMSSLKESANCTFAKEIKNLFIELLYKKAFLFYYIPFDYNYNITIINRKNKKFYIFYN